MRTSEIESESFESGDLSRQGAAERILSWYGVNGRDLPWRRTRDPYAVWVSEIMLQQTQAASVIPYYHRFLAAFPTLQSLAKAPLGDVLRIWENLGYYSRARHLHRAAQELAANGFARAPDSWEELIRLPGVGPYTAGAVLSIAYGKRVPAVDGNVLRVLSRLLAMDSPLDRAGVVRLTREAERLVPEKDPGAFNQALMDLGALLCAPKRPLCAPCPLRDLCAAFKKGVQEKLPIREKRKPLPHKVMTAGIIQNGCGRLLIVQRPEQGLLAGMWRFPGGEKGPDESLEHALRSGIYEELGLRVQVGRPLTSLKRAYTHFRMTLHAFLCVPRKRGSEPTVHGQWLWADRNELGERPFSKADRMVAEAFLKTRRSE